MTTMGKTLLAPLATSLFSGLAWLLSTVIATTASVQALENWRDTQAVNKADIMPRSEVEENFRRVDVNLIRMEKKVDCILFTQPESPNRKSCITEASKIR